MSSHPTFDYSHVLEAHRHKLDLPVEERIKICRHDFWIDNPKFAPVFECLGHMLYTAHQIQASCIFIYGNGGGGKSAAWHHLKYLSSNSDKKMVFIELTENTSRFKLHDRLCQAFGIDIGRRSIADKEELIFKYIADNGICAIVIDELNDALLQPYAQKRTLLSLMRNLAGTLKLCVIAFGNTEACSILTLDRIIDRRFVQYYVSDWKMGQDFVDFLATYEAHLPLKIKSNITCAEINSLILSESYGIMDNVVKIMKCLAMDAIESGAERISATQFPRLREIAMRFGFNLHVPKTKREDAHTHATA
ncbi:TniB family NTP-binding protein [Pseudomonas juntendi]|uniref:TniB family NTP-binding protein n=1 Tax=Pseudomonas juntendi TaxID=2666183 RepID=UPI0034541343